MTIQTKQRIQQIYHIALSVLLFISAACFIGGAIHIYSSTDRNPYTYESISRTFGYIAIPVLLTLVAVALGVVVHFLCPPSPEAVRASRDKRITLSALRSRLNFSELDESLVASLRLEQAVRRILFIVNISLYAVALIFSLVYTFLPSSFTGDYNASVVAMVYVLIAALALPVALQVIRVFIDERSIDKELAEAKRALVEMKERGIAPSVSDTDSSALLATTRANERKINLYTKIGISVLAVAFIVIGICGGGMADVLSKAIKICTECIGLG
ncbi:MAG: hypothetical protein IJY24_07225 [Clostridia bacterium]|nr:hypothetical protein [Clostridia bacterium]